MTLHRPDDLFDRVQEWADIDSFLSSRERGIRVGIVYGRRRQGKSFLLRRVARAARGFYHQALQEDAEPALRRFGEALGAHLGVPGGQLAFRDWEAAVSAITELDTPVVLDEFPYLMEREPALPSMLQRVVDASRTPAAERGRLIVCGSALSVMTGLLHGQRALRGRVQLDLAVDPFDFRTAAAYWGLEGSWAVAFHVHAILGGTPGYRDLVDGRPPRRVADLGDWVAATVGNPASALFREDEYLLAEERGITDRALYQSILAAISQGNRTESTIAAALGRDARSLAWPLGALMEGGFVRREEDVLRQRRPVYRLTDPIIRFHHVITRPDLVRFEERRAVEAWNDAQERFSTHVLGPHFEDLSRAWVARFASRATTGGTVTNVGRTVVNDASGRSQQDVDVVALGSVHRRRREVRLLGEAKAGTVAPGVTELARLERVRDVLSERGDVDARGAKLAIFSAGRFRPELRQAAAERRDVELVDLDRLYTGD